MNNLKTIAILFISTAFLQVCTDAWADTFDAEQAFRSDTSWEYSGKWDQDGGRLIQSDSHGQAYAFFKGLSLVDGSVSVRFKVQPGDGVRAAGLIFRSKDAESSYFAHFDSKNDQVILFHGNLNYDASEVARKRKVPMQTDRWYTARVDFEGHDIKIFLDDKPVLSATDGTHKTGLLGVYTSQGAAEFKQPKVSGREQPLDVPWKNNFASAAKSSIAGNILRDQKLAKILDVRTLCKSRYIGWPSIGMAANGDLIAVFSGDRSGHVSPDGKTQMIRSSDGGKTWSKVITIQDLSIDDRDAGIMQTSKGTLIVSWFTGPPYHTKQQGAYVVRSSDNGKTWGKPIRTSVSAPHGPVQLANGRLLYIGQQPHCSHVKPHNYNGPPAGSPYKVALDESNDDGKTWKTLCEFPVPKDGKMLSFDEPHLVEVEPGRIVAMFRDCNKPDCLWQSESSDGGSTWTAPRRTKIQGHPPHLLKLKNGWLVVVYAKRQKGPKQGQYACISRDGGRTWDVENEIRLARSFQGDMGYPGSVQLPDGSIWTVFYQAQRPGEKPALIGTHWSLKED